MALLSAEKKSTKVVISEMQLRSRCIGISNYVFLRSEHARNPNGDENDSTVALNVVQIMR